MKRPLLIGLVLFVVIAGLIFLWTGCGKIAEQSTQSTDLITAQNADFPDIHLRKIVIFEEGVSQVDQGIKIKKHGAKIIFPLKIINAQAIRLPDQAADQARQAILKESGVASVDDDIIIYALPKPDKPPGQDKPDNPNKGNGKNKSTQVLPWGIDKIDAELAIAAGKTGAGVKVAVLDTGIDLDHPDLNVVGGINFMSYRLPWMYDDDHGHGTHCAGIIAGLNNRIGVIGVAPDARLYAVKVLSSSGSGSMSGLIAGIQWCIENDIDVMSMSLGGGAYSPLQTALRAAITAGIVPVAAAGNSGDGEGISTVIYPAAYPESIAVSATDQNNIITSFSSRGPEIDIAAPGLYIYSTYRGGGYGTMSGTSMACPHVAGVAALVVGSGRGTTPNQVRKILLDTADDLGKIGPDEWYGYGLVDALQAATGRE